MPKLTIGQPAPHFCLPDLDGEPVSLADFMGKIVALNFWSAECPWAERADRALVAWQDHVTLLNIAVNQCEPLDMLCEAAAERGLRTVLLDAGLCAADLFAAQTTPHFYLIDGAGLLRYQGAFDNMTFRQRSPTRAYVLEAIEALLLGAPVPVMETPPYGCTILRKLEASSVAFPRGWEQNHA
jgi:hypothetical protein